MSFSSGSYVTRNKAEEGLSETITSWRTTGNGVAPVSDADTCDKLLTLYDPFDFSIEYRIKWVKVKHPKCKGVRCFGFNYYYKKVPVPYPYYTFVKKTLSVRNWRMILSSGSKVVRSTRKEKLAHDEVALRMEWLIAALKREGKCRPIKHRQVERQNDCTHFLSKRDTGEHPGPGVVQTDYVSPDWPYYGGGSFVDLASQNYKFRFWEPPGQSDFYVGESNTYVYTDQTAEFVNRLSRDTVTDPMSALFSSEAVATLTAMLWPDSGDFNEIGAQPLVDIAEAVSEGTILGPPPNPGEAYTSIMNNALSNEKINALRDLVDFSANAWLWTTLVVSPVVQSAMALCASVQANDDAIEKFQSAAKAGNWIQGKSLRVYNGLEDCDIDTDHSESWSTDSTWSGEVTRSSQVNYEIDVHKMEGNALFSYKLDQSDADLMNTSGVRIGHFLQRLSTDVTELAWNIVPLSFVVDWFTSEFTGRLDLRSKIYMPVADWKLTLSHSVKVFSVINGYSMLRETSVVKYRWQDGWFGAPGDWVVDDSHVLLDHCPDTYYKTVSGVLYKYVPVQQHFSEKQTDITEEYKYYHRQVYNKPIRRSNESIATADSTFGLPCFNNIKPDPLDMGKAVTLGALLWGLPL